MMAWRRDPPAARLIQALPIVTGRAAPHPHQHADNPGHQTTHHRLCRPPAYSAEERNVELGLRLDDPALAHGVEKQLRDLEGIVYEQVHD